jgi:stearoyl-CoA desaturase (delta-9 desaturase)
VWFLITLVSIHMAALLAFVPQLFTLWGIPLVLAGNFVFGSLGINLGYHRMLTHKAAVFPRWLERFFVLCGVCSLEGSPLWWVCVHRMHHQYSDEEHDPHSPQNSFFWGHMEWIYTRDPRRASLAVFERYVPDLLADPFLRWLHRGNKWVLVYALHALLIGLLGVGAGVLIAGTTEQALWIGLQVFIWGVVVRTVYVWHITWLVNSASHRWGYQSYRTSDRSRNNWFVALLTNGEGWHNNHHATPRACSQGHRWWELDLTFTFVRLLQCVGLAWDVVPVKVPAQVRRPAPSSPNAPTESGLVAAATTRDALCADK